ncbi:signal recognition particle protein Srp19 [Candidatus Bathyarchaeota archaeon]|nr:signal recognition particle protein Srp19 [Candidatus Bathyarchaeota archaeon]
MRGRGKTRLWPVYFDAALSRGQGRRVPKEKATRDPTPEAIEKAAQRLGLNPTVEPGLAYSKQPWIKSGLVQVDKKGKKSDIIAKIAQELRK